MIVAFKSMCIQLQNDAFVCDSYTMSSGHRQGGGSPLPRAKAPSTSERVERLCDQQELFKGTSSATGREFRHRGTSRPVTQHCLVTYMHHHDRESIVR